MALLSPLAGTFNDWNSGTNTLTDPDGDGIYSTEAIVDAGEYRYKFVVSSD